MSSSLSQTELNASLRERISRLTETLSKKGIVPRLAMLRIGESFASKAYEKGALKRFAALNLPADTVVLPENTTEAEAVAAMKRLAEDPEIHGILLLEPLPPHLRAAELLRFLPAEKDVDGQTDESLGRLLRSDERAFASCAPAAVMEVLDFYKIPLKGKRVVLVGSGRVVGKPLAMLLVDRGATVTMTHIYTEDIKRHTKDAEILISCAGSPHLIDESWVEGSPVTIDVGTASKDGKLTGDLNIEHLKDHVSFYTTTPGGIGAVTTSVLALHVCLAASYLCEGTDHA